MIKRNLTLILFILFPILINGQDGDLLKITLDYCNRIEKLDWKSSSKNEIAIGIQKLAIQIRNDYQENIVQIKKSIKESNINLSDKEIEIEFSIKLIVSLIDKCDSYLQSARNILPSCPKENKSLILLTEKIDSIIDQNKNQSYPEQLEAADNKMFDLILDNESQVEIDYKDGVADLKLPDDLSKYLLHKSNKYCKAYVVSEFIKRIK